MTEARRRFDEGVSAYDNKDYEAARVAFAQAYALEPLPELLINLGHAELKTGRNVEGCRHIAKALREAEIGLGERRAAEHALENAEHFVARIKVAVNLDGADLVIDGQDIAASPMIYPWYLEPGEHRVRASKEGFQSDDQVVTITKGQLKTVRLNLLRPGEVLTNLATPTQPPVDDSSHRRSMIPVWIGGGLSVAGIATGVVFTVIAANHRSDRNAKLDDLSGSAPCGQGSGTVTTCNQIQQLDKTARRDQTIGFIGFGVGGAALLGTITYVLLTPSGSSESSASIRLTPVIGPQISALNLSGAF
ncbi:MAG TPA: PEGA domain-containing protein [Polyangiaceae bacterium]|nr:PEGA domain-containing protein [Polyangiaceae bacterium]